MQPQTATPKKEKKTVNDLTYGICAQLNQIIGKCKSQKGFSITVMFGILDLKKELETINKRYTELLGEVMKLYNIPLVEDSYNWEGNRKYQEISDKVQELLKTEVTLTNTCFMTKEQFLQFVEGIAIEAVSLLRNILVKK